MHPWIGRLIVNFVLCLICFISYSSQIFIIWPWYGRALSVELIALLLPFNVLVGMLLWNYFLCVVTDPGRVPDYWKPDTHAEGYEVKKLTGTPRYCRVCEKYKPPRTHHCQSCNRCTLRMDHHCPWINNCVGHFNYGHFIRFLFFVDLACSYHISMVTCRVYSTAGNRYWDEPSPIELIFTILNYVACVPVLLMVGGFSIYHFYCLLGNTTTIEGWEKDRAATMVRRGKLREVKFPYDIGVRKNIESVLGKDILLWCWPTRTPGTGLKFELANSDDEQTPWPPHDPTISHVDDDAEFVLPSSPWTYENGSVNPALEPYNTRLRGTASQSKRRLRRFDPGTYSLPPYHPDYEEGVGATYASSSDSAYGEEDIRPSIRRGSEGYEVLPVAREDMLGRYLRELGEEPGRYHRYIPSPNNESETSEDDLTLARTIEKGR